MTEAAIALAIIVVALALDIVIGAAVGRYIHRRR